MRRHWSLWFLGSALLVGRAPGADLPEFFHAALAGFATDAPQGWAYTVATSREGATTVERFDPSRPPGGQWTLVRTGERAPAAAEIERYLRYKAGSTPPTVRATFSRGDLDLGSMRLVREDDRVAEYQGRFRPELADPLLTRLAVRLTIAKQPAHVRAYTLRLTAPYAPALGVRMHELSVTLTFSPPTADHPSLPATAHSRFRGRLLFFKSIEEDLRIVYADFTPLARRAP